MTDEKDENSEEKIEDSEVKEYGVVLLKEDKYRHRIYPQKGKVPQKDKDDAYKVV